MVRAAANARSRSSSGVDMNGREDLEIEVRPLPLTSFTKDGEIVQVSLAYNKRFTCR